MPDAKASSCHSRSWFVLLPILLSGFIASCGGGSTSSGGEQVAPPSALVYPHTTINATVGTAINADTPTVTGSVTGFSVAPVLPAGLSLNASSGSISGIPTSVSALGNYIVTATNGAGSTTATLQISVSGAAPSNLVYPQTTINAIVGTAISADTPTVTGSVTGFSVAPALPAGFSFNATTGTISGTPATVTAQANYTVTATNAAGSTTATLQISVSGAAPSNLIYPQTTINATVGIAIQPDTPTVTGSVTGYGVVPELPAGLSLDGNTGVISGTPTAVADQATYVVSAEGNGGVTSTQLTITVKASGIVLLDQGHQAQISQIFTTANDLLSSGDDGHWVLWDYSSGTVIAEGEGAREIGMGGQIFGVLTLEELEVHSAQDGHLLFTIPAPFWFKVATDGSYICSGDGSGMTVRSTSGQSETVKSGDYSGAIAFAAPGQVQVANGGAGSSVIEIVDVPSGSDTVSPAFSGKFQSWFEDGSKFITQLGNVAWVYSNAGVQQAVETLPTGVTGLRGGWGNWVWSANTVSSPAFSDVLQVYEVGSATSDQSYTLPADSTYIASGSTVGALAYGSAQLSILDLSGTSPSISTFSLPPTSAYLSAYAANSSSQWIAGNEHGVLIDGASLASAPRFFGYGAVEGISGGANVAAISTAIGKILLYDLSTSQQSGSIDFLAGKVSLSMDGTVLGAAAEPFDAQYVTDRTLNFYSLPSMAVIQTFPYTFDNSSGTPFLEDFSVSGSGTVLGEVLQSLGTGVSYSRQVTGLDGTPTIWSDTGVEEPIKLSPDGTLIAVSNGPASSSSVTNIYLNGTVVAAVSGDAEGWIDNGHLLVATYTSQSVGAAQFNGSTIYSPTGAVISTLPSNTLPAISNPQFPTANSVYDAETNAIYSLTTGLVTWQGAGHGGLPGAVAGSTAIYEFDNKVILAPTN